MPQMRFASLNGMLHSNWRAGASQLSRLNGQIFYIWVNGTNPVIRRDSTTFDLY